MNIEIVKHGDTEYKVKNGTYYHIETDDAMIMMLEFFRINKLRVRFHWGDAETGKDWGDIYDVAGTVSRSTGSVKIPILVHNERSMGGTGILTNCIVRIAHANKKKGGVIYQHPNYHVVARGKDEEL